MALSKQVEVNGAMTEYHRVVSVTCVTNVQNTIEVGSYLSAGKRAAEKLAAETGEWPDPGVRVEATYHATAYEPGMDAAAAYGYLKGLPLFAGAEDC